MIRLCGDERSWGIAHEVDKEVKISVLDIVQTKISIEISGCRMRDVSTKNGRGSGMRYLLSFYRST